MLPIIQMLGLPFLACIMMVLILGHFGIHVLKREVIFIDIALAQIVAAGSILAHIAFGVHGDSLLAYASAFGLVLLVSAFYALARSRVAQIPLEAVIGVSYAIAAAGALFLVGTAPGGHVHIQEMLAGSLLWTTWKDIRTFLIVFCLVSICLRVFRKPLNRTSENYADHYADETKAIGWDFLFYALQGLVITVAVRMAGVVVVFAFLIIPATISATLTSRTAFRLVLTWAVGVLSSLAGLLLAYHLDFSVGPTIAMFLGLVLTLTALGAAIRGKLLSFT